MLRKETLQKVTSNSRIDYVTSLCLIHLLRLSQMRTFALSNVLLLHTYLLLDCEWMKISKFGNRLLIVQ